MATGTDVMKIPLPIILCLLCTATPAVAGPPPAFTAEGYRVPQPGAALEFPRAHASHPDYAIEWWYLTGHLHTTGGRRFGYQATFFRSALKPPARQSGSAFGDSQLYLAHMALTDPKGGRFHFEDRLARDGWDAWARMDRLDVRNGHWRLSGDNPDNSAMELHASAGDATWSLRLRAAKPLVRFGEDGTSRKGPAPEARSYYLSFTRLETEGTVRVDGAEFSVSGLSWMDHEIASSQLDPDYVGWDWIAIQLEDGWEVKAYLLRQSDGSPAPFSRLIWIDPDGRTHYRNPDAFRWRSERSWRSPATGARYPVYPEITTTHPLTGAAATFRFEPLMPDQELDLPGTTYWEGAGRILDAQGRQTGSAYLELVGYAGPIEGLR
jgi:predicted secreted hydrolase